MDTVQIQPSAPKQGSYRAVIIVILIIALGGAYFWYSRSNIGAKAEKQTKNYETMSDEELQRELDASGEVDISADMRGFDEEYK